MLLNEQIIKSICFGKTKSDWLTANTSFPDFIEEIPKEVQLQNEVSVQSVTEDVLALSKKYPRGPFGKRRWKRRSEKVIRRVLHNETILGIHNYIEPDTIDSLWEEICEFLRHARQFAPELSMEDLGQALRNYMVYAMFNILHCGKPGFNISDFGYSMLYPFTDNYIDNAEYLPKEKENYNQLIRDKIEGKAVCPDFPHHRKTCELLQMIQEHTPKERTAEASLLLLMMLDAQQESLRQQNRNVLLSPEERLNISLYKGGISVLIDRFFVNKELTEEDLCFYLGFGFFLQLADDLQDIREDSLLGYQTLFTVDLSQEQEEKLVNQLFHYIYGITNSYQADNEAFKCFVLSSCYQLILMSVDRSREYFSPEYLKSLECLFPITYDYFDRWKKERLTGSNSISTEKSMHLLDELIFS